MHRPDTQVSLPWPAVAGAFLVIAGSACSSSTAPKGFCTAPPSIAIEVNVRDSVSGAVLADSAFGTVVTPTYQDSLRQINDSLLRGGTQLGTYSVTVHRPSYADWVKSGVRVARTGECGNVIPAELEARLVRAP